MKRRRRFVEREEIVREAVPSHLDTKAALLFKHSDLVAAIDVTEIEKQIVCLVALYSEAIHRSGERQVQQRADLFRHLAISQIRRDGEIRGGLAATRPTIP
jgi:hypothetical protein